VVESSNHVVAAVADFHDRLGIDRDRQHVGPKRWVDALAEVRDKALETGAGAVDSARTLGTEALDRARSATDKLTIDSPNKPSAAEPKKRPARNARLSRSPWKRKPDPPRHGVASATHTTVRRPAALSVCCCYLGG
jgi:hypothetical protein